MAQATRQGEKNYDHRPLLDKLGIRPGMRVSLMGLDTTPGTPDAQVAAETALRTPDVHIGEAVLESDVILYRADAMGELDRLAVLKERIKRNGAIWVISPRGLKHFTDRDVMAAGLGAGLVDVKVARYSATHTAAKFVFRLKDR